MSWHLPALVRRRRQPVTRPVPRRAVLEQPYPGEGPHFKRNLCVELACVPGRSWR